MSVRLKTHHFQRYYVGFGIVLFLLALGIVRSIYPERALDYVGPRALLDLVFSLSLWFYVTLVCGSMGWMIVNRFPIDGFSKLERGVIGLGIGYGLLGIGIFILGWVGFLNVWNFIIILIILGVFTWRSWEPALSQIRSWSPIKPNSWKSLSKPTKWYIFFIVWILMLAIIQAVTPPWDYDGLMYHLQAPRIYLEEGTIRLLPDVYQANGANLLDMLFVLGMSFGSDVFAKLIHLTFACLVVFATYGFGRKYISKDGGVYSAIILIAIPIIPFWASFAYTDMALALYEFLALWMIVNWAKDEKLSWLVLAGIFTGLALHSKYLALGSAGIFGFWVIWHSRNKGWRSIFRNASVFALFAILFAFPIYLRNLIVTGNPVYPFIFGGPHWDQLRLDLLMSYLQGFGTGKGIIDYILTPVNLIIQRKQFTTFMGGIELPSLLFILAFLYPFLDRSKSLNLVAGFSLIRLTYWAFGSQQLRFLLPIFPTLSILASSVLISLVNRSTNKKMVKLGINAILIALLFMTLYYSIWHFIAFRPLSVIFGIESKEAFLDHVVGGYGSWNYIQSKLPEDSRVLMPWDGRGYYCDERCIPDPEQSRWSYWFLNNPDLSLMSNHLSKEGITHINLSIEDINFLYRHDAASLQSWPMYFLIREFLPNCAREIYSDEDAILYELTCP